MDTRRLLIAAALSLAVLIGWQMIFPPPEPGSREPQQELLERRAGAIEGDLPPTPEPGEQATSIVGPPPEDEELASLPAVAADQEEELVLEDETLRAVFSNRGAQLVSFELKDHPDAEGGLVDLVRQRATGLYPFAITDAKGNAGPLTDVLFASEHKRYDDGSESLWFEYSGPEGRASKSFLFEGDGTFSVTIRVPGSTGWGVLFGPGVRNPSQEELESRFAGRSTIYNLAGDIERVDSLRMSEPQLVPGSGVRWIGLQDTYFLTSWIADTEKPIREAVMYPLLVRMDAEERIEATTRLEADSEIGDALKNLPREQILVLVPAGEELIGRAYWGAKEFDRLAALPYGLERTVNLGIFSIIARPLLWVLRWIFNNVVHNYGWSIVLVTLLVRVVLFPLTHKSVVSMQKMQELNPKMQAIRQKYRAKLKDKQGRPNAEVQRKMNEEIMGLYKAEGVNPAGGCLPMLLQMPVFFAFYNLLSSAIELRHAPWVLWIEDLSAMDPYYILPIFMGVCMLVQQRMMPSTAEPMQRRMMMMMPFFITFICLKLPSGLALYWATSNLLGIAQQGFYQRLRERATAATAELEKASKKQKQ